MSRLTVNYTLLMVVLMFECAIALATIQVPYAVDRRLTEPELFAEGIISTGEYESHPAFTPDGRTLYFVRSSPQFTNWTIYISHHDNGRWSVPKVAPFSGKYRDADPFITSDGKQLYFISDRPTGANRSRTWISG